MLYKTLHQFGFLFLAVISIIISLFFSNTSIDIHLHDTYFVLGNKHIFGALAFLFIVYWSVYFFVLKKLINSFLYYAHLIICVLLIISFTITIKNTLEHRGFADVSFESWQENGGFYSRVDAILFKVIAITIILQLIFPFQLFIGLYKKIKAQKRAL